MGVRVLVFISKRRFFYINKKFLFFMFLHHML